VDEAKVEFDRACAASKRASTSKKRERKPKETVAVQPTRKSSRVRGEKLVNHAVIGDNDEVEDDVVSCHLTCDEFCAMYELTPGPMMTGSFGGWVEESVRVQCGIAARQTMLGNQTEEVARTVNLPRENRRAIMRSGCCVKIRMRTSTDTQLRVKSKSTATGRKLRLIDSSRLRNSMAAAINGGSSRLTSPVASVTNVAARTGITSYQEGCCAIIIGV